MYTKQDFINDFIRMGLNEDDTVFVHSSYKAIAGDTGIDGGADTIIDALIEYFGEKGLVVFPSLTWKNGWLINDKGEMTNPANGRPEGFKEYGTNFDVKNSPCHDLGIIPELFRQREGVVRSLCPTSSVAAYGKDAEVFCQGHEKTSAFDWSSPWGKLYQRDAKFLFIGTGIACNTFMHVLEEKANVPGLIVDYVFEFTVTDYDGKVHPVEYRRHFPGHNHFYDKIESEFIKEGIAKVDKFGSADVHIIDGKKETDYMMQRLKDEPYLFTKGYCGNEK